MMWDEFDTTEEEIERIAQSMQGALEGGDDTGLRALVPMDLSPPE